METGHFLVGRVSANIYIYIFIYKETGHFLVGRVSANIYIYIYIYIYIWKLDIS